MINSLVPNLYKIKIHLYTTNLRIKPTNSVVHYFKYRDTRHRIRQSIDFDIRAFYVYVIEIKYESNPSLNSRVLPPSSN